MQTEFITLVRDSAEAKKYFLGTFSNEKRALIVTNLNSANSHFVTFQIVPLAKVQAPRFKYIRLANWHAVLFLAVVYFLVRAQGLLDSKNLDEFSGFLAFVGSASILVGAHAFIDYMDHLNGWSDYSERSLNQPIAKGWITAEFARNFAVFAFTVGVSFGLYPVIQNLQITDFLILILSIGLSFGLLRKSGFRYWLGKEALVFFLFGPVLIFGLQRSLGLELGWRAIASGALTGGFFLFYVWLKNLTTMLQTSKSQISNSVGFLGFDRSVKILKYFWLVWILGFMLYFGQQLNFHLNVTLGSISLAGYVVIFRAISRFRSPVGSASSALLRLVYIFGLTIFLTGLGLLSIQRYLQ